MVSVATFLSNVFYLLTSNYFSTASDEKPLLHTWSLAVEEQYYVLFPLILPVIWQHGRRNTVLVISILAAASLAIAQWLSVASPTINFYLISSRTWELLSGALAAMLPLNRERLSKFSQEILPLAGLLMIGYSIFAFDKTTPFPSLYTLVPVLGTVIIIKTAYSDTITGKLLGMKPLVGLGLISYSLYLWHQPLFALHRAKTIGATSSQSIVIILVAIFLLSYFTWKYIEKPFRDRERVSSVTVFRASGIALSVIFFAGLAGHIAKGFPNRFVTNNYVDTAVSSPKRAQCHTEGENFLSPNKACKLFNSKVEWAVLGDSHVVELAYAMGERLQSANSGVLSLSFSNCPPAFTFESTVPGCSKWIREAVAHIVKNQEIKYVVVGFRHSMHLLVTQTESRSEFPALNTASPQKNNSVHDLKLSSVDIYWNSFKEIIDALRASGKTVYVLYPIPELPAHINKLTVPETIFHSNSAWNLENTSDISWYWQKNSVIVNKLNSLLFDDSLLALKPAIVLCNDQFCRAAYNGKSLYFDDNHLSIEGARQVASLLKIP